MRERLRQIEASLVSGRARLLASYDQELASVRSWLAMLENDEAPASAFSMSPQMVKSGVPSPMAGKILTMPAPPFANSPAVVEARPAPGLEQATVDELNAALAAAFQVMAPENADGEAV